MPLPAPLTALIQSEPLRSVLCVDAPLQSAENIQTKSQTESLQHITTDALLAPTFQQRFDLVWLSAASLQCPPQQRNELIAKCRDQIASRVLLEVREGEAGEMTETECLALGFVRCAITERHHYYLFDLKTYKPAPDWLNPKFWANPQNWDKFRW